MIRLEHANLSVVDAEAMTRFILTAALEARMRAAGFSPNMRADEHPARDRRYFYDPDGNDWEFVCYHSNRAEERNDYSR